MSWLHRVLGKNGSTQMAVDPTHFAARVAQRPMELGTRGSYGLALRSGTVSAGLGAAGEIFQMRWTDATRLCLLRSIQFNAIRDLTAFTAGSFYVFGTHARGWSADGGGGTATVFSTANTNKRRTSHALSLFSDTGTRITSGTALTAGTKTFDTNPFCGVSALISSQATTAADNQIIPPGTFLWQRNTADEYPIVYAQNEGFALRATVPATGTWSFIVQVEWAEIDPTGVDGW